MMGKCKDKRIKTNNEYRYDFYHIIISKDDKTYFKSYIPSCISSSLDSFHLLVGYIIDKPSWMYIL